MPLAEIASTVLAAVPPLLHAPGAGGKLELGLAITWIGTELAASPATLTSARATGPQL